MSDIIQITCMYTCALCGIVKAHVQVPAREESQDVVTWVREIAAVALAIDHNQRSPDCHPKEFTEIYIPITGAKIIGGPTLQ